MAKRTARGQPGNAVELDQQSVLGIDVPASTVAGLVSQTYMPGVSEGWLYATIGGGAVWAVVWFMTIATAFLPEMPAAAPDRFGTQLRVMAGIGLLAACGWGWWYSRYRRLPRLDRAAGAAELQRLCGWHRVNALLLLLLFGAGMVWQASMLSANLGVIALVAAFGLLAIGYRWAPILLRFIAGEYKRALAIATGVDKMLLLLTGLVAGGGLGIPLLRGLPPVAVFLSMTSLVAVAGLPFVVALLAWAMLHFRAARSPAG